MKLPMAYAPYAKPNTIGPPRGRLAANGASGRMMAQATEAAANARRSADLASAARGSRPAAGADRGWPVERPGLPPAGRGFRAWNGITGWYTLGR